MPTSLAYHLSDIYLEELDKAMSDSASQLPTPLSTILTPFFALAARTPNTTTYQRVQSEIFSPLFASLSPPDPQEDEPPSKRARIGPATSYSNLVSNACFDSPKEGKMDGSVLQKRLLRRVFQEASEPETRDANRRKMYALWRDGADEGDDRDES